MGRSIPPLQQLPHGLIENRIAPQRQHITHGKHITHDNQHINKQHEHQPIGEAMTNHHAEDGDKKSILDARIERAYANEYERLREFVWVDATPRAPAGPASGPST